MVIIAAGAVTIPLIVATAAAIHSTVHDTDIERRVVRRPAAVSIAATADVYAGI